MAAGSGPENAAEKLPVPPVAKGQVWYANGCLMLVTRCARGGAWADIAVEDTTGATWRKRHPLPFPEYWQCWSHPLSRDSGSVPE
jgi:hypothetical protein